MPKIKISFVMAHDNFLRLAEELLAADLGCEPGLRQGVRAVAKALIDETDEMKRGTKEAVEGAEVAQLRTISPPEMLEKARSLQSVSVADGSLQAKVQKLAKGYVHIAEENQRLCDEFMRRYRELKPPGMEEG